jgi:hypothetical protein
MDSNYEILISKINEFTQKFYLNKLLRGLIYTFAILLSCYLLLFVLVYYTHPGTAVKTALFYSFVLLSVISVSIGIIRPALAYFRFIKSLSTEDSARMIGLHFTDVRDKLLNTLQLKELADLSPGHNQLILAGINQKINDLKPIPFSSAIRLNENKKNIKYFLIPLSVIVVIGIISPAILKEGTSSFVQYNKEILPAAPFNFNLLNSSLTVIQGENLRLELNLTGDELPQDVYVQEGINTFKFEKDNSSRFHYLFKNLQKTKTISFSAGGFSSRAYQIEVKPRPQVLSISASLSYPAYLKRDDEKIKNASDLLVPEGTIITWDITTENSDRLSFFLGNKINKLNVINNIAVFKGRISANTTYRITPENKFSTLSDSLNHKIAVITDLPPEINVTEQADSLSSKALYFTGSISDDHGFSALKFSYTIKEAGAEKSKGTSPIRIKPAQTENSFFHFWNLKTLRLKPGQLLEYFFEVTDNDAVNGFKTTRSTVKTYVAPSEQQIARQMDEGSAALKQKMEAAIKQAAAVEKDSKKLGENLLDKKSLSFEDKKEIAQLLEKQKKLEAAVEEIKKIKEKNSTDQSENSPGKDDLANKQKQIDDLFNHMLDPKTKSLLEKLQGLMDQNNKDQTQSELSKMNVDNKSLRNELDRILELYKQLEFEQSLQNKVTRLNDLAQAQKELAAKAKEKTADPSALKNQQQQLSNDFNAIKKELDQLQDKNQSLERPNAYQSPEKESQRVQQQQQQSIEQLDKKQQGKAAEAQEKAAEEMKDLAEKLDQDQQQSASAESNLSGRELRLLLQNLLYNSFEQEKIMLNLRKISSNDPSYITNVQSQRAIKDNMKTIADSLLSLGKRVPQIESSVNEEMQKINFNLDKSLANLAERRTAEAVKNQQYTMTSINNLSLLLNEALEQLEKNKKNSKGGKGKSSQSMQQLQQMQQQLNKNMQQAKDQLQQSGNKGTVPKGQMSEEFAKMAQQQQMIREALQKINTEENKDGKGSMGNLNQLIKEMKLTETDLVNKRIEEETIKRQQTLLTKLLDAEKATRDQDQDGKRESKSGRDFPPSYQKMLDQFKKREVNETELLQKLPPSLNYYYKNRISDYLKSLNLQ